MFGANSFSQVYFGEAGANYTTVTHSITKSLEYCVKVTKTAATKSLQYTVKTTPSALTKSLKYTVKKAVSVTKSLEYCLKTTPSALTKSLKYTIKVTPAQITKSLAYILKRNVSLTKSLKYTVKVAGFLSTGFDGGFGGLYFGSNFFGQADSFIIASKGIKQLFLTYKVKTQQSAMAKSLKYTVKTTRAVTKSLTYHVSPIVKKSLKYTIKAPQSVTKSLEYTIHNTGLAIKKSLTYEIKKAGFMDLYIQQNTPYATNDLYVQQNTTFTNLY